MVDVEADVVDRVTRAVHEAYPEAYVSSRHVVAPPRFPAVLVVESSNLPLAKARDSSGRERASSLVYTVSAYSNSEASAKRECRDIMGLVSGAMRAMNMERTLCGPVDNAADPTIYRMVARFAAVADERGVMYHR